MSKEIQLTKTLSENIQQQLMSGTPLTRICKANDMPSLTTVYKWLATDKEFAKEIIQARRIGCQTYLDKMIEELDTVSNKDVGIVREKLHHYRWLASKLLPNLYGDKQEIIQDTKITIEWNTNKEKIIDSQVVEEQTETLAHVKEFSK